MSRRQHPLTDAQARALAQDVYDAVTKGAYAREVVDLLKKHGLATKKQLAEWCKETEENHEDRR